jgi:hypothetical protein
LSFRSNERLPMGSQYCTDKAGAIFCESISRAEVVNTIENSFLCLISCDESTDFKGDGLESVYVQNVQSGKLKTLFCIWDPLNLLVVRIYISFWYRLFRTENAVKTKCVELCTDGASKMQGKFKVVLQYKFVFYI